MKNKRKRIVFFVGLMVMVALAFFTVTAGGGDLEPSAAPGSTMHTLDEIYNGVNTLSLGSAGVTGPVAGAVAKEKAYMQVSGIAGESTDPNHTNWIETLAVYYQFNQPTSGEVSSGGARTGGTVAFGSVNIIKEIDKASPDLYIKCCAGTHIATVDIEFCKAGSKQVYHKITLTDVVIVAVKPTQSYRTSSEYFHLEEVSLRFGRIAWIYYLPGGGTVEKGWNLMTNTEL